MPKLGPRMTRFVGRLPFVLAAMATIHPISRFLARWDWRADLITHFQEPALFVTLVAIVALARRRRLVAAAFVVLAGFQVVPLLRYSGSNPVAPRRANPPVLRVLTANVLVDNDRYRDAAAMILREQPDVVGFLEYSDEWAYAMAPLAPSYAHRYEFPDGPRGLALWFRERPLEVGVAERVAPDAFPYLHAKILFDGRERNLWLVHPSSPIRRMGRHAGFPEMDGLAATVADVGGSCLVMGDMNTTDGSPHFADFLRTTRLRDSRLGFGRQASWPAWSPYRIAIDHALVSDDLAVVTRKILPPDGSDHFALMVELAPAAAIAAKAVPTHSAGPSH